MVKYIVLKEGKRGYTLVSIHPKGRLGEARSNAIWVSNKDRVGTMVCEVLERHEPKEGILIAEAIEKIPTVEFDTVKEVLEKGKKGTKNG